ncbi:hypothetical protein B4099_0567 [Heyndrickxia coagulans]|jgi:hypothetical protein|uniref:Uncharacterized protein n=1 Tax=Heyndrickxia coagulans TaxID=1398 RepID=A0A150KIE9_HEYCO|nr:hypothetical protein B4099_0567 [Heyndrickxia coagulans]
MPWPDRLNHFQAAKLFYNENAPPGIYFKGLKHEASIFLQQGGDFSFIYSVRPFGRGEKQHPL